MVTLVMFTLRPAILAVSKTVRPPRERFEMNVERRSWILVGFAITAESIAGVQTRRRTFATSNGPGSLRPGHFRLVAKT